MTHLPKNIEGLPSGSPFADADIITFPYYRVKKSGGFPAILCWYDRPSALGIRQE